MDSKSRIIAAGFAAMLPFVQGAAPVAGAAVAGSPDIAAFYLQGTCLCTTVPVAQQALGLADGYLAEAGPITGIGYPAGLLFALDSAIGATGVNSHLDAVPAGTKITLAGVSQGAIVLDYVKQSIALRVAAERPPTELTFVTFGDPMNTTGGIVAKNPLLWLSVPPGLLPTPYDTTEIVREYDGIADWPDRFNPLAATNAVMGVAFVHPDYGAAADPSTPGTLKTVTVNAAGGTTTHYVIPTADLPITAPLRIAGIDTTVADKWLRPYIDSAYVRRPQVVPDTTAEKPASASSPQVASAAVSAADTAAPTPAVSVPQRISPAGVDSDIGTGAADVVVRAGVHESAAVAEDSGASARRSPKRLWTKAFGRLTSWRKPSVTGGGRSDTARDVTGTDSTPTAASSRSASTISAEVQEHRRSGSDSSAADKTAGTAEKPVHAAGEPGAD
ncbi:PE-PPE domain-containing protein [Mycolicibacterium fluoranthenivorans]|uniref:PE-PPE domain-containing protein n=1 Tax=Mycolicibacterium fluoranthenivorans TaxID=258505 RepID=A0A7X5ZGG0_9MYCO|nr:PE-PPE domain-containing protein [Mycolicibacterium fluoranthenivorans]MCV7356523.1 PE-PPE domain-containing protein [Mycolicibacterium fluoranthenivorans]NIH99087.1 hypothetical protein [Mycolicibacterium fluoranthenivorans]